MSATLALLAGWVALEPAWIARAGRAPGRLVGLIGVTGVRALVGPIGMAALAFAFAYVRLARRESGWRRARTRPA